MALLGEDSVSEDTGPTVTVTCYFEDTPVEDRSEIEGPLSSFVEDAELGEWVGSGQGSIGERAFFDVTFEVHDLDQAIPRIQSKLRELKVGAQTEVEASDGRKLPLKIDP